MTSGMCVVRAYCRKGQRVVTPTKAQPTTLRRCLQAQTVELITTILQCARHSLRRLELCLRLQDGHYRPVLTCLAAGCTRLQHLVDVGRFVEPARGPIRNLVKSEVYAALSRLTRLALIDTGRVTDGHFAALGTLPELRAVSIQGTTDSVTDTGVAALAQRGCLREVVLQARNVTGGGDFGWERLRGLQALLLWSMRISIDRVAAAAAHACPGLTRLLLCGAEPWACGARVADALQHMRNMQHATLYTNDASAFARRLCATDAPPRLRVLEFLPPTLAHCVVGSIWPEFSAWAAAHECVVSVECAPFCSPIFAADGDAWADSLPGRCGERGGELSQPHRHPAWLDLANNHGAESDCKRWEDRRLHLARGLQEHRGELLQREAANARREAAAKESSPVLRYRRATLLRLRAAMGDAELAAAAKVLPSAISQRSW